MCGPKIPNFEFRNIRRPKRPNSENDQIRKAIIGNENDFSAEKLRNFEGFNRDIKKGPIPNFESRNIRRSKRPNLENDQIRKAIIGNEEDFNAENPRNFDGSNIEISKEVPKIPHYESFESSNIRRRPKRPNFENDQIRKAIIENVKKFNTEKPRNFEGSNSEIKEEPKIPNHEAFEAEKPRNFEGFNREIRKRAWHHKIGSYLSEPKAYPGDEEFDGQK